MTKDAINQAIAEWRGWADIKYDPIYWMHIGLSGGHCYCGRHNGTYGPIPNYYGSLDCIAEAEGALNFNEQESTQLFQYRCALTKACGNDLDLIPFATAPQRCEALLRTLNLWKE